MCFGSSKPKTVVPPPPSPPTTFDYSVADRGLPQQKAAATANAAPTPNATFGSELGTPAPTAGVQ